MKPVDVAKQLNIGGSTVRAWSKEFGEFLSATAAGGDNRRRDFNLQDVQILSLIKQRSDHNTPRDEITAELSRLQADDWRELPPLTASSEENNPSALVSMATAQTAITLERQALLREISTMQNTVRELKTELATEREDKEKLLREISELNGKLQRALTLVELYEKGRLKPDDP
jgi:DNA-binding transcriptional MerR regulator